MTNKPTGTLGSGYPAGTGNAASSGFQTATANGTYSAPTSGSGAGSGSATGSAPAGPSESGVQGSTGGAARLGMDLLGLTAVGVFGAMLVL